jgi:hypothetical protein
MKLGIEAPTFELARAAHEVLLGAFAVAVGGAGCAHPYGYGHKQRHSQRYPQLLHVFLLV